MEKIKCNACGASDVEPKIAVQDRADLSFGEVQLCPDCGSEDIDADESDCLKSSNTSNVKHTIMSVKFKTLKEPNTYLQEADNRIKPIKLIAQNGYLYINWDDILSNSSDKTAQGNQRLALRYFTGGCDEVCWPKPNIEVLRGALFYARKTGWLRHVDSVLLPNGEEFFIDQPYWKAGDHITWTDPDDGVCSRTGILQSVTYLNDSELHIVLEDGWAAEVNESELQHA